MELKAGRKLDALVAEHVMGWDRRVTPNIKPLIVEYFHDGKPMHYERTWTPSTDIAAAWEVVESDYWSEDWGIVKVDSAEPLYQVWDLPGWELETGLISQAYSAPLAICLAALKAVGGFQ